MGFMIETDDLPKKEGFVWYRRLRYVDQKGRKRSARVQMRLQGTSRFSGLRLSVAYSSENLPQLHLPATPQPPAANNPSTTERLGTPKSKWLELLEYDSSSFRLTVHFKTGLVLQHLFVYPQEWTDLKLSSSKGSHYSKHIQKQHQSVHIKAALKPSNFPKRREHHE